MAAKKKVTKRTPSTQSTKPNFKEFDDVDLSTPPAWKFEEQGDWVYGTVVNIKTVTVRNLKQEEEQRRVMVLNTDVGKIAVWESALLSDVFDDVGPGVQIYIEYDGKDQLDHGRTMNKFIVKIRNG